MAGHPAPPRRCPPAGRGGFGRAGLGYLTRVDERRASPRAEIALQCTLHRGKGTPIGARTVDLGPAGMCISCSRPLRTDEVIDFDLPLPPAGARHCAGRARVLRQQRHDTYALRFEGLAEATARELLALTTALGQRPQPAG